MQAVFHSVQFQINIMELKKLDTLIQDTLSDSNKLNGIVDLQEILGTADDAGTLLKIIPAMNQFFANAFNNKKIAYEKKTKENDALLAKEKLKLWMRERYSEYCEEIILKINTTIEIDEVRSLLQESILEMIQNEVKFKPMNEFYFPTDLLVNLMAKVFNIELLDNLFHFLPEYLRYDDFRHFLLRCTKMLITHKDVDDQDPNSVTKFCDILLFVAKFMPKSKERKLQLTNTMDNTEEEDSTMYRQLILHEHRKKFEEAWLCVFNKTLHAATIKRILTSMHSAILPNFANPCLLADFLSVAYSQGGGLAVLSLHGLFILMTEHNLEYPEFYKKLYSLLHPRVFSAKYAPRFFHLLNIFLSSTHLPAYLVAAFAKKLCRLMLVAPTNILAMLIPFVVNLLKRHSSIRTLLDRPAKDNICVKNDPFVGSEEDPAKCCALESSLWELETMTRHYNPEIAILATINQLPFKEVNIGPLLEISTHEFFEKSIPETFETAPMNFSKPAKLFGGDEDSFSEIWKL